MLEFLGTLFAIIMVAGALVGGIIVPIVLHFLEDEDGYQDSDYLFLPIFTLLLVILVLGGVGYYNLSARPTTPPTVNIVIPGLGHGQLPLDHGEGTVVLPNSQDIPQELGKKGEVTI